MWIDVLTRYLQVIDQSVTFALTCNTDGWQNLFEGSSGPKWVMS